MHRAREDRIELINQQCAVPQIRKVLGDHEVFRIVMPNDSTDADRSQVSRYFPGTEIVGPYKRLTNNWKWQVFSRLRCSFHQDV